MGLFDYVRYEADCPHCGKRLTEFQTKDGDAKLTGSKQPEKGLQ